jgi:bifunctional non-homologous end joining protein LigD
VTPARPSSSRIIFPREENELEVFVGRKKLHLTNLQKVFWPEIGITKRDLLQYYADIAVYLIPHLKNRAAVMKRYPEGAAGDSFFMKRAPAARPVWIRTCPIGHTTGLIEFPIIQDLASLLWLVNLGCIDLNPWYARCDDIDLDPVPDAGLAEVREAALRVRDSLHDLGITSYAKTSGSRGMHIYVPIRRGPAQKQVWSFAKEMSQRLAAQYPGLITSEYRVAKRPKGRVLLDYNQNAWGRTLASAYSVRPTARATVSAPVTWEEVERGFRMEDFHITNMPVRLGEIGDLWKPLTLSRGRVSLERVM